MEVTITKASIADIPQLVTLINSAYRGEESKKGWTTEADLLEGKRVNTNGLEKIINTPGATILKCTNENENIIGCVYLKKNDNKMYLGMLTVAPQLQNSGIGKQLLQAADMYAKEHGCTSVVMSVISVRKELIQSYERQGYMQTGATKPFPMGDVRFGIPKQPLEFVILEKALH